MGIRKRALAFSILVLTVFTISGFGQPVGLDQSFGVGGIVITPQIGNEEAAGIIVQPDGKIVITGTRYMGSQDILLIRYNIDGSLDSNFGSNGIVVTDVGTSDYGRDIAIQPDGKLLVTGDYDTTFMVIRYNNNGSIDSSFGIAGKVFTSIGYYSEASSSAIQDDGKIVVGGSAAFNSGFNFTIIRYNLTGSLDTTFGNNGISIVDVGNNNNDLLRDLSIQADGKIVAAGLVDNGVNHDYCVIRLESDGSPDSSFNGNGKVTTDFGFDDLAFALTIQSDGKLVVSGRSHNGIKNSYALTRYNVDGTLDASFDSDGKVITDLGGTDDVSTAIGIQLNGKIIAGEATLNVNNDFGFVRYNVDGSLDTSFGNGGKLILPLLSWSDYMNALLIQADGKILAAGGTQNSNDIDVGIVRLGNQDIVNVISGKKQASFSIFPNPCFETLAVHSLHETTEVHVEVLSLTGIPVLDYPGLNVNQNQSINLGALTSGVYFIRISSEDNITIKKFIKQN
jgi:uncharacterized delta-60 repeat protein